jgi:hypothetical protein
MKKGTQTTQAVMFMGKVLFMVSVAALLWACPLILDGDPSPGGDGLTGMWECVLMGTPPAAAYDFLYINEDLTYTQYFCLTVDGVHFQFLSGNASNRGTYTESSGLLNVSVENKEYFEDEWKQAVSEAMEVECVVEGDTLTAYVDANGDGDYDDERETVAYQRRSSPLDLNGDGDFLD